MGTTPPFVKQLESKQLTYIAAIAKNRQVTYQLPTDTESHQHSVSEIAQALTAADFIAVELPLNKPRTVWVTMLPAHVPKLGYIWA